MAHDRGGWIKSLYLAGGRFELSQKQIEGRFGWENQSADSTVANAKLVFVKSVVLKKNMADCIFETVRFESTLSGYFETQGWSFLSE